MTVTVVLGEEHDAAMLRALLDVLAEMGADVGPPHWSLAGSQEITTRHVTVDGCRLVVEAETYMGLSLTGEPSIVTTVAERVRQRISR